MNSLSIKSSQILFSLIVLISFLGIMSHTSLDIYINFGTYLYLASNLLIIALIFRLKRTYDNHESSFKLYWPVILFLIWNVFAIIRGIFMSEYYWDYKSLVTNGLVLLIPVGIYVFTNPAFISKLLSFWLKYALIFFIIYVPFATNNDFFGRYLAPILLLLILFPLLTRKWQIIVGLLTAFVILVGLDARTNVIRFSVAALLGLSYYFRFFLKDWIMKTLHTGFMLLPVILLILGVSGIFNIFKMDQYISGNYTVTSTETGTVQQGSLTADTRTFLYVEVISSAIKHDYVLWGRTPARGYDSLWFGSHTKYELGTGRMERYGSEVSIHNIFTWTGLIGAVLYFLIFFQASFLAIYRSNNYFIKLIGLFVAFRWVIAFVEDFTTFEINYLFLWIMIAMCFSSSFRAMSDAEFKTWIRDLLRNARLIKLRK